MAFGGFGAAAGAFGGGFGAGAAANVNTNGDSELTQVPTEPISCIAWAPHTLAAQGKNLLAAGSWDKTVRIWDIQRAATGQIAGNPIFSSTSDQPVFDCCMSADGRVFFGGGCQGAKMANLAQAGAPAQQVAQHDLPVKGVRFLDQKGLLVTGGWDGKLKIWDLKSPQPGVTIDLKGPFVGMDIHKDGDFATVCTARQFIVINMTNFQEVRRMEPHYTMREQLRCVACFPDKLGFAAGSIEGRVCVLWMDQPPNVKDGKNFSFKCHRENTTEVYSVNGISFHQQMGTFATCGSDGNITYWDKDAKSRLKTFTRVPNTIPCGSFDSSGLMYAYAISYDWTKGQHGYNPALGHKLCIKGVQEADVKPKPKRR